MGRNGDAHAGEEAYCETSWEERSSGAQDTREEQRRQRAEESLARLFVSASVPTVARTVCGV